ncbi:response regulator [Fulvimarina sp. 2208YS6-2-32]|nr:response regulator [Fulvimarina sp. 2208YS6-2-32]
MFDDMPVILKIGERLLTQAGYEVTTVGTIDEVARHIETNGCADLMILSGTGSATGIGELIRSVRDRLGGKRPVILVSVIDRAIGPLMRYRRAGANGILLKPFDADGFRDTIAVHTRSAELAA